ncbi:MAG: Glycosyltransferase [Parcubacteria bacterium C7867-001]|nr:MAG: Glycosyltransferase [Parcubacteria bacterium C7867-001]
MKLVYLSTARVPDEWAHVIQIMKMCEAFADAGHDVTLAIPQRGRTSGEDPFTYAGVRSNFRIVKLPCVDVNPGSQGKMLFWLRTFSFLVVARCYLLCTAYDLLYTRELFALGDLTKTVFELHSQTDAVRRARHSLIRSRAVVCISQGLADDVVVSGIPREKLVVAPDGVSLGDFERPESSDLARKRLGIPSDKPVALYIGILDTWKGVETLYAAAALMPEVRTVVIGAHDGAEKRLAVEYPHVTFIPFQPYRELANNQQIADVLILPNSGKEAISAKYTSPLKLFSYMASGKPIVASDLPSLREVLSESNTFFAKADDPASFAATVRYVLAHPEEARARASAAQKNVTRYSWTARAEHILSEIE